MATENQMTGNEQLAGPDAPGTGSGRTDPRTPYRTPRLRRLGNIADVTKGTGTGPGTLGTFEAGREREQVRIYGDYSTDQVGSILNGRPENQSESR